MAIELFDTHLHICREDAVQPMLAAAQAAGVAYFVAVAGNLEDAERLPGICAAHANVFCTAGTHPHEAEKFGDDLAPFRRLLQLPPTIAVGEIGLDYYYDFAPRARQKEVFTAFLGLAVAERRPVVVHCRDAYDDCLAILQEYAGELAGIEIHSFTGTPAWAEKMLELGAYFSFNGILTFEKAANVRASFAAIPLDRLLLETDSPYLAPVPHRGQRNQPAYLAEIARQAAILRGLPLEQLAAATTANGKRFFQLP